MGRSHSRRSCRRTPLTSGVLGSLLARLRGFSEVATRPARSVLQQPARNPVSRKPLPRSEISEGSPCPARFRCLPSEGSARPMRFCCADSEGRRCPVRFWSLPLEGRYGISGGSRCPLRPADKIWEGSHRPLRFSRAKSEGGDGMGGWQARGAQRRRGELLGTLSKLKGCADASEGHGRRSSCRSPRWARCRLRQRSGGVRRHRRILRLGEVRREARERQSGPTGRESVAQG